MKSHPAVIFFYFLNKEYVLAHTEMPTTLEGAEAAIKKQEDFMTTMDANEEKIDQDRDGQGNNHPRTTRQRDSYSSGMCHHKVITTRKETGASPFQVSGVFY